MTHTVTNSGNNITLELSLQEFTIIMTAWDMVMTKSEKAGIPKPDTLKNLDKDLAQAGADLAVTKLTAMLSDDK